MKQTVVLLALFFFVLSKFFSFLWSVSAQETKVWQKISQTRTINGDRGYTGIEYSRKAYAIRGKVTCTGSCSIYLMTKKNFDIVRTKTN
jgi:hypothetical protein